MKVLICSAVAALAVAAAGCGGSSAPCAPPNTLNPLTEMEPIQESIEYFVTEQGKDIKLSKADREIGKVVLYEVGQVLISPDVVIVEFTVGSGIDTPFGTLLDNPEKAASYLGIFTRDCAGDDWDAEFRPTKAGSANVESLAAGLRES